MLSQFRQSSPSLSNPQSNSKDDKGISGAGGKARAHACVGCRNRKVRCDFNGATQCTGCQHRGIKCELFEPKPRTARAKRNTRLLHLEQRVSRLQSLCQTAGLVPTEGLQQGNHTDGNPAGDEDLQTPGDVESLGSDPSLATLNTSADDQHIFDFLSPSDFAPRVSSVRNDVWAQSDSIPHPDRFIPLMTENGDEYYPEVSSSQLERTRTDYGDLEIRGLQLGAFTDRSSQPVKPYLPAVNWPSTNDATSREMHLVESTALQAQTNLQDANTAAINLDVSTNFSMSLNLDLHFQTLSMIFADTNETHLLAELHNMTPPSTPLQLPPRDATYLALTDFFRHINKIIPLYDEATTFHLMELFVTPMLSPKPDLAAYIYSVVALSYTSTIQPASSSYETSEETAWSFFSHAARYIPQLMAGSPGLLSIQALLGMSVFLLMNGAIKTSLPLISITLEACRAMHHDDQQSYNARRIAQLYETAFLLYHRISLRLGIPMTQCADIEVSTNIQDVSPSGKEERHQSVVGPMLSLISVTRKVLDALNASTDQHATTGNMVNVLDLNRDLEDWRRSLARPIRSLYESERKSQPTDHAQTCLQICYYQILLLINQTSMPTFSHPVAHNSSSSTAEGQHGSEGWVTPEFRICVDVARETIRLVKDMPAELEGFLRALSVHVVRAATILFINIVHVQPRSSCLGDFALLCSAQKFLQMRASRAAGSKSGVAVSLSGFLTDLTSTARNSLCSVG